MPLPSEQEGKKLYDIMNDLIVLHDQNCQDLLPEGTDHHQLVIQTVTKEFSSKQQASVSLIVFTGEIVISLMVLLKQMGEAQLSALEAMINDERVERQTNSN